MNTTASKKRNNRRKFSKALGDIYAALIYSLFYIPVLVMMIFSFSNIMCVPFFLKMIYEMKVVDDVVQLG